MMMILVVCLEIWKINNLFQSCEIFRQPEHKSSQSVYFLSWKLILTWQEDRGKSSNDNIPCSAMAKISLFSSEQKPCHGFTEHLHSMNYEYIYRIARLGNQHSHS